MFKDFIWDFDGTLFDTYPGMVHAFKLALVDEGINENEENILNYMKKSAQEAINHYQEFYGLGEDFVGRMKKYDKEIGLQKVRPFPYAEEICKWIVDCGARNHILTHRGYTTHSLLKKFNMEELFIEIVTKNSGFKRKPDPEGYAYLIDKYKMDKDKVLIVGDRELEILAAKAVGVKVCLYDTNKVEYFEKPDYIISSLEELKGVCN